MSQNKNTNNTLEVFAERIVTSGHNAGMVLMAAASTLVLAELGHHGGNHSSAAAQPAYAYATAHGEDPSAMRREKLEETHQHGANSATNQRTPGRTGKA